MSYALQVEKNFRSIKKTMHSRLKKKLFPLQVELPWKKEGGPMVGEIRSLYGAPSGEGGGQVYTYIQGAQKKMSHSSNLLQRSNFTSPNFTQFCYCRIVFIFHNRPLFSNFPLFRVLETQLTFMAVGEPD